MKILIAGFAGEDNSAKILLDHIKEYSSQEVLYLKDDFEISSRQIEEKLQLNYDYVLVFGQKPNTRTIYLENNAVLNNVKLETDYYYGVIKKQLENNCYKVESSLDAGKYKCNNVFFSALSYKKQNKLKTKIAFIHIPTIDNIESIEHLASVILNYINSLMRTK